MWATPLQPSPRPWPPNTILPFTKPPPRRHLPLTISAAASRNNAGDQGQDSAKSIGNMGKAVLTAVKSKSQQQISKPKQNQKSQNQPRELSGADVLWALQKKAAAAANNSTKKTKRDKTSNTRNRKSAAGEEDVDAVDYSNVRPLCVKGDWSSRIVELEKQLQELMDNS